MNTKVLFKNYKKYARGNWSLSKNKSDIFKGNKNIANLEKNDKSSMVDSDYSSDSIWEFNYFFQFLV